MPNAGKAVFIPAQQAKNSPSHCSTFLLYVYFLRYKKELQCPSGCPANTQAKRASLSYFVAFAGLSFTAASLSCKHLHSFPSLQPAKPGFRFGSFVQSLAVHRLPILGSPALSFGLRSKNME